LIDVDGDINAREMMADQWRFSPIGKQNPAYDLPFFLTIFDTIANPTFFF